jgi:hypothetical protein
MLSKTACIMLSMLILPGGNFDQSDLSVRMLIAFLPLTKYFVGITLIEGDLGRSLFRDIVKWELEQA